MYPRAKEDKNTKNRGWGARGRKYIHTYFKDYVHGIFDKDYTSLYNDESTPQLLFNYVYDVMKLMTRSSPVTAQIKYPNLHKFIKNLGYTSKCGSLKQTVKNLTSMLIHWRIFAHIFNNIYIHIAYKGLDIEIPLPYDDKISKDIILKFKQILDEQNDIMVNLFNALNQVQDEFKSNERLNECICDTSRFIKRYDALSKNLGAMETVNSM